MTRGLFITGTGTDVGKTFVTGLLLKAILARGKNPAYYKAAMSGNRRDLSGHLIPWDALAIQNLSGTLQSLTSMCPYVYEASVSPHLAARWEGPIPDPAKILSGYDTLANNHDIILMEGSGGILCPLRLDEKANLFLTDIIHARDLPCLIVADAGLGTINAVGLTAAFLKAQNITLHGLIFNRYDADRPLHVDNVQVCQSLTGLPVLACIPEDAADLPINPDLNQLLFSSMEV